MDMMAFLLSAFLLAAPTGSHTDVNDKFLVMFWNLENFFDWKDDGVGESDSEFSSRGKRHWTMSRFYHKSDLASKAVFWIGNKFGIMPDVIGVCEVENRGVLYKWLNNTLLRKYDYSIVHYDSGDKRGIDVALLYRKSAFRYVSSSRHVPSIDGNIITTRDILEVALERIGSNQVYHFIVNHHPSKFAGGSRSDSRRYAAIESLKSICDSLLDRTDGSKIVAMGDFNDNPSGQQFELLNGLLVNKALSLHQQGMGTIRFQGKWELIDMFLVDNSLTLESSMEIVQVPFLMAWDNSYPGYKPFRTYSGPRYIGGVSDHCPIILQVREK